MIPREILKKIRQIELGTNRIVTETLAGFSFQPSPQFRRIPRPMPNGNDFNLAVFDVNREINRIRPRFGQLGFVRQSCRQPKPIGVARQRLEKGLKFVIKSPTHTGFLRFIPIHGLIPFPFGFGFRDDFERHFLASRRFLISAETSSIGVPRPGCLSASSARRSSSAICSGVSSSSKYSSRTFAATSYCSASGKRWICSRICVALMELNLPAVKHFASA
jgi:hypothetical protein